MSRSARSAWRILAGFALAAFAVGCGDGGGLRLGPPSVRIESFVLVGERALAPTVTESTYRARCRTDAGPFDDAIAFVSAPELPIELIDATLRCGRIARGATTTSADTIVLHRDPSRPFDASALGWITLAFGPQTLTASQTEASGARRLRYEVEFTNGTGKLQAVAAGVTTAAAGTTLLDGLVTAAAQRNGAVRTSDSFEVRVARGAVFDPAALVWTLSVGTRSEFALGATRTLDGVGQPLGDVAVEERGPSGIVLRSSEPVSGIATLAESAGSFQWRFEKADHLPVWRAGTLAAGQVLSVPSPWLQRRNAARVPLSVLNGGVLEDGEAAVVRFAGGAFASAGTGTLTIVDAQSLPAPLPAGWSPLAAFWLEASAPPRTPGSAELRLADRLAPGERAFFVRFAESTLQWIVADAPVAVAGDIATTSVADAGAYAVVVADIGATAPPPPVAGQPLPATTTPFPLSDGLTAQGSVVPPVAPASLDPVQITAAAEVVVTHPGSLPSGLVLRSDIDERYDLRDGTSRSAPSYETFFTAYQRPGDDDPHTLHARFPLRPQTAVSSEELDEAVVQLEILPVSAFEGGFFDASGGRVGTPGVLVTAPAGAVTSPRAVEVRGVDVARFADLAPPGALRFAFELAADGLVAGVRLALGFGPQTPDAHFVVARFVQSGGRSGLEPRERFTSDASGVLRSVEPAAGDRLPGVTGSGQYVLVRVDGPQALVQGVARNSAGAAVAGLAVTITGEPWLTFSSAGGAFQLVAPIGDVEVVVTNLIGGDRGSARVSIANAASVGNADLGTQPSGPRVVEVDPADAETGVKPSSPIRVRFSESVAVIAPGDLQLVDADGREVPATLSTNLARSEATLLPIDPLASGALHTLTLADTIADASGLPLEGPRRFTFTTQPVAARGAGAELISWEPGAQTSECDGVPGFDPADATISCVAGGAGTADPNASVVLVNETRGTTATVLSGPDGSFKNFIDADVDDFIAATFVNGNGTRIRIPLSRQLFDDGAVALFQGGGILEAESDGGPVQVQIEPGTIQQKNKFKVEPLDQAALLELIQASPPDDATLLGGGFRVTVEGAPPAGEANLSFPVDPATLDLPPDVAPEEGAFAAAIAREVEGGTAYQVVDKLRYEDGKIASNTFPFLGMLLGGIGDASDIFSLIVVPMLLGSKPTTVTGRVLECPGAQCLGLDTIAALQVGRPLPGAFVTLSNPGGRGSSGSQRTAQTGRLQPGMVYATAGPDGRYALVAPFLAGGYVLSASHPRHASAVTEPVIGIFDFSISGAIEKNLIFDAPFPGSVTGPVRVNAAHEPVYPASGQAATLQVNATHGAGAPTVAISLDHVESLIAGAVVSNSDVQLGAESETLLSPTRKRVTMDVTATPGKALVAVLRVHASVSNAAIDASIPPRDILHAIAFGVGPAQVSNDVVQADANDGVGPVVVNAIPSEGAVAVSAGDPLTLFFNEPIAKAVEVDPGAVTFGSAGGGAAAFRLELAPDQRSLQIRPGPLLPDTDYSVTVTSAVRDLAGNAFDQDPGTAGPQSFVITFHTAPSVVGPLAGVESGGGAVLGRGAYAFVLNRAAAPTLVVQDVSNPSQPVVAATVALPGAPRDLVFIPQYRSVIRPGDAPRERDILAVVGGDLGTQNIDDDGNLFFPPQYLRLFDVTDPVHPSRISHTTLSLRPATITRVEWRPPFLVYLENGADVQAVGEILLQELMIGANLTPAEIGQLPLFGVKGIDGNGDGDFTDTAEGDRLPQPNPSAEFFGKVGACTIDETTQRILDFDFAPGYCGLTLAEGKLRTLGGSLGADVPPQYRTVLSEGNPIDRAPGSFSFAAGARPKRMAALFNTPIEIGGAVEARNLVLVSLSPDGDGVAKLAVIDISLPASPQLLNQIPFDAQLGLGLLQTVSERTDGLLALATTTSIVLLDPRKLALPAPADPGVLHPTVVGVVADAGSGAQSLDGNAAGINVVSLGGKNQVVQSAPRLRFVAFTGAGLPVDPSALVDHASVIETELAKMRGVTSLAPARVRGTGGATTTLDPASRTVHYHVIVDMPGGAGSEVEIALESLDRAGESQTNPGRNFAPVRAAAAQTLSDLGQPAREGCDAPIHTFTAKRLASDKASPFYNLYLSKPFALTYERLSEAELDALRGSPDREILWSGYFVRASIDPGEHTDAAIGSFASKVDASQKVLRPGSSVTAKALPSPYVAGPNPPPPGGSVSAPGTFGTVNAGNGELRVATVDLALPSPRMPIVFERTLGGQDLHEGVFGRGWDFNYGQRLVPLDGDVFPDGQSMPLVQRSTEQASSTARSQDVVFQTGGGGVVLFKHAGHAPPPALQADPLLIQNGWLDATDYYLPQRGVFDALLRFSDGQFLRVTPEGQQFWYSSTGRLERIYHRYEKNRHVLSYNDRDELVRIVDASVEEDRFLRLGYYRFANDPIFDSDVDVETTSAFQAGKVARLLDSVGRSVDFEYNADGLLERRIGTQVDGGSGGYSGRPTLEYLSGDACSGDLLGVRTGNGGAGAPLFVAQVSGQNGQPTASGGASAAGPVTITPPTTNEAAASDGSTTSVGLPGGVHTDFRFDANGLPSQIEIGGSGASRSFGPRFDDDGRLVELGYPNGARVDNVYDTQNPSLRSRGNLLSTTRTPGQGGGGPIVQSWSHDGLYNLPSGTATDANGNTIEYTLGFGGRDVATIDYGGDGTATFHYDAAGLLSSTTSPLGVTTDFGYDPTTGFKTSESVGGRSTGYAYDGSIAARAGSPTTVTPPGRTPISMAYDQRGLPKEMSQPPRAARYAYDENANPTVIERETGQGAVRETRSYEPNGFLLSVTVEALETDGGGPVTTTFTPDAAHRIGTITYPGGAVKTLHYDPLGYLAGYEMGNASVAYTLDESGNVTETKSGGDTTRTFVYDGHDRMIEMRRKGDSGDAVYGYGWFPSGVLQSAVATDSFGTASSYEVTGLDAVGRPTGVIHHGDTATATIGYSYTAANGGSVATSGPIDSTTNSYDAGGEPTGFSDSFRSVGYVRDASGAATSVTSTEDGVGYVTSFGYDALGFITSVSDGVGSLYGYSPRADGAATSFTDADGHTTQQSFTKLGELLSRTLPDGLGGIQYKYNGVRKPTAVLDVSGAGNTYAYSTDFPFLLETVTRRDGEATSITGRDARGNPTAMSIPGGSVTQRYDLQSRMTAQTFEAGTQDFSRSYEYDAMDRIRVATFSSGGAPGTMTYRYDALGPLLSSAVSAGGASFTVGRTIRDDGARTQIAYPSITVDESRRADAGLLSVSADGELYVGTLFAGKSLPKQATLGGVIAEARHYDLRGRLLSVRYDAGGEPLVDLRYHYDGRNNPIARQDVHRAGRADFFGYDAAGRLARVDVGARPESGSDEPRTLAGFAPPAAGFLPGLFARSYGYDGGGRDLLESATIENPDGLDLPPFPQSWSGHDALLHAPVVDGFTRGATDALGNVVRARLAVRSRCAAANPCDTGPALVPADLSFDGASHLVGVTRDDGVAVAYDYQHDGLFHTRRVAVAGQTVSERHYVWDGPRLIEEYEGATLVGRYFYRESDAPFAADLRVGNGLQRFFYLQDASSSVVAVADAAGVVRERIVYDPFGQPVIEGRDTASPEVAAIVATADGVRVQFSEPILPPIATTPGDEVVATAQSVASAVEIRNGASAIAATASIEEGAPGFPFGAVLRVRFAAPPGATLTLHTIAGRVRDEWGNGVLDRTLVLSDASVLGAVVFQAASPPQTAAPKLAKSALGSPFAFHGQWFDADAGLLFLRARFYDPSAGAFLQRDPDGMIASANAYAGFSNNPVGLRDPLGRSPRQFKSIRLLEEGVFEGLSGASSWSRIGKADTALQHTVRDARNAAQSISDLSETARVLDRDVALLPTDLGPNLRTSAEGAPVSEITRLDRTALDGPAVVGANDSTLVRGNPVGPDSPASRIDAMVTSPSTDISAQDYARAFTTDGPSPIVNGATIGREGDQIPEFTLRGGNRSPAKVGEAGGYFGKGNSSDVVKHVLGGKNAASSRLVSTSTDPNVAVGFAGETGVVALVNTRGVATDVEPIMRNAGLRGGEAEFVVEGGVPLEDIVGWRPVVSNGNDGLTIGDRFIPNPRYRP